MSFFERIKVVRPGTPRPGNRGIYCTKEGVFIGSACPLVTAQVGCSCGSDGYRVRPTAEINALLRAAFGIVADFGFLVPQLQKIASYLDRGELNLAQIATLYLGLPELPDARSIERLSAADSLLKGGFNPDEPRDERGRWTSSGSSGEGSVQLTGQHSQTAQVVIPEGLPPDCVAEYLWAYHRCSELANDGAFGPRSGFGSSMSQCIRGMVSARCGGNPV